MTKIVKNKEHAYIVRKNNMGIFCVIQESTGTEIACDDGEVTANRVANTINACTTVRPVVASGKSAYKPFTPDCGSPEGTHNFFLIRPQGIHPASGKKYVPQPVQLIDGQLYTPGNEIDPMTWSLNGDICNGPTNDPYSACLEWMPLPD